MKIHFTFTHMLTTHDAKPESIWSRSLHIYRILTTAPLTHSNDACNPSVCLLVILWWHTVACSMPSFILSKIWNLTIGKEATNLNCSEQNGARCQSLASDSQKGREIVWGAHCSIFSYCEIYLSAAPLEGSQSSLTTEDMFSLCENQTLWYTRKMLFSFFFYPQLLFMGNQLSKLLHSPKQNW